jgi:hypothetical protein
MTASSQRSDAARRHECRPFAFGIVLDAKVQD